MVAACHKLFGFPKQCFRGFTCCALCKRQKLGGGLGTRLCLHSNKTKMYRHIIFKSIYLRSLLWALWITLPICIYVTDHCLHSRLEQQTGTSFIPRPLLQRQVRTTKHYSLIPRPLLQRQVRTTKHYSLIPRPLLQRQVRTTKHYSLIPRPLLQRQVRTTKHYSLIPRPLLQRQVRTTKHYSLIPRPLLQRQVRTTKHYSLIPRPLLQKPQHKAWDKKS